MPTHAHAASRPLRALACAFALAAVAAGGSAVTAAEPGPAELGAFSAPFTEPLIKGKETAEVCIEYTHSHGGEEEAHLECKPAAGSQTVLADGRILYWNALEGTERIRSNTGLEFGTVSANDQSRLLSLHDGAPAWTEPSPSDGGANENGYETEPLVPGASSGEPYNDGALFCSDFNLLADGRVLAVGGTAYYNDPGVNVNGQPVGLVELEGLPNTRIFDPATSTWVQGADMSFGRWYPSLVTLGDGRLFVASGVKKLLKPVYRSHPQDSGRNVVQTETYDPARGEWTYNGASADRSLPLYPRLHLLPNGHVYFNAAGQVFNPFGQAYDEALWNLGASYDPQAKTWTGLGVPGLLTLTPGFRGSTFSVMLPLRPGKGGRYTSASFLSAGGILGTSPGTYFATTTSAITTIDTAAENALSTQATGSLNLPRWYSTAVLLPTGEVAAFNGADKDEVDFPGTGFPTNQAELFDPKTRTWRTVATSKQIRTYHNTAALLPDGQVLVGGHAPIPTLYGSHQTLPGGFTPNEGRDPSFEIYSPPYLFRGDRPEIEETSHTLAYGKLTVVELEGATRDVASVVLVRNPSITHLVDGDQRSVELRILARSRHTLLVATPPDGNVAPPGPYMLFVNRSTAKGLVPSVAEQVSVGLHPDDDDPGAHRRP